MVNKIIFQGGPLKLQESSEQIYISSSSSSSSSMKYVFIHLLHKQDVTQCQFSSSWFGIQSFSFLRLVTLTLTQSSLLFAHSWIHTYSRGISMKWNENNFIQDLNSDCWLYFWRYITATHYFHQWNKVKGRTTDYGTKFNYILRDFWIKKYFL